MALSNHTGREIMFLLFGIISAILWLFGVFLLALYVDRVRVVCALATWARKLRMAWLCRIHNIKDSCDFECTPIDVQSYQVPKSCIFAKNFVVSRYSLFKPDFTRHTYIAVHRDSTDMVSPENVRDMFIDQIEVPWTVRRAFIEQPDSSNDADFADDSCDTFDVTNIVRSLCGPACGHIDTWPGDFKGQDIMSLLIFLWHLDIGLDDLDALYDCSRIDVSHCTLFLVLENNNDDQNKLVEYFPLRDDKIYANILDFINRVTLN